MAGDGFWQAEVQWQSEILDSEFLVELVDSRTEGPRFKTFVTYNLVSTLCPTGVRRRYSDFEWLRDLLKYRFHGIAVPTLPEKKVIGNQGAEFIEERMRGLASFMRNVVANPYLRNDHTLRLFLTLEESGAGEWEQAKKAASAGEGSHPSANLGLNRWFGVLRHLSLPPDADAAAASLSLHLIDLEKALAALLAALTKYVDLSSKLSDVLGELKTMTGAVETTATSGASALGSSPCVRDAAEQSAAFAAIFSKFGTAVSSLNDLSRFGPNEINMFLVDPVTKELSRISGMRELLAIREAAAKEYNSAWQKQEKLEFEQKQFALKGRQDKASLMEPQVAQASQYVKQCRERLDDITKGLLHVEARKFGTVRNTKFIHILGQYGALGTVFATRVKELWTNFLGSMGLTETDMVTAAQRTLPTSSSDDATLVRYVIHPIAGMTVDPSRIAPTPAPVPTSTFGSGGGGGGYGGGGYGGGFGTPTQQYGGGQVYGTPSTTTPGGGSGYTPSNISAIANEIDL